MSQSTLLQALRDSGWLPMDAGGAGSSDTDLLSADKQNHDADGR